MKFLKRLLIILMMVLIFLPLTASAETKYNTLNLEGALKEEEIEYDFSNYSENDDQITIYLFRGKGCAYCRKFLNFINSIVDEYGEYFKVESYEVWYDENNANLMTEISNFMDQPASGVPYIIIGDKVFAGYTESYDEDIKTAIKNLYDTKKSKRYDVMKEYNKNGSKKEEKDDSSMFSVIIFNVIFTLAAVACVTIYDSKKRIDLESKISKLEEQLNNKKGSKKNEK